GVAAHGLPALGHQPEVVITTDQAVGDGHDRAAQGVVGTPHQGAVGTVHAIALIPRRAKAGPAGDRLGRQTTLSWPIEYKSCSSGLRVMLNRVRMGPMKAHVACRPTSGSRLLLLRSQR